MKIAYFDLIAGASGDMLLGALLDAGLSVEALHKQLSSLNLIGFELKCRRVNKNGFSATKADVVVQDLKTERKLPEIQKILQESQLPDPIIKKAIHIFRRLGEVESHIHGIPIEQVHLHELGGIDTIVDVVGVLSGMVAMGIEKVFVSPIPLGRGFIPGAHGQIPLPAPATVALLEGIPVVGVDIDAELVTPTGAVLLATLGGQFGEIPPMVLESVGYGAGGRDLPIPNLLRVFVGEMEDSKTATFGTLTMLETNIDDLNPEIFNYVMDRLFKFGALDVFLTPIQMKKNRPATLLQVLALDQHADRLRRILFKETSTLGIRQWSVQRYSLEREIREISISHGRVKVKIANLGDGTYKVAPEFEDCRILAESSKVPIREIYFAAQAAAENELRDAEQPTLTP